MIAQAHAKAPTIKRLYGDCAYAGKCALAIEKEHGSVVEIVRHPGNRTTGTWHDTQEQEQTLEQAQQPEAKPAGFVLQAKRWVVERTHAWNERSRRLMAHHDRSNWAPVAWVWLVQSRILAAKLGW